MRSILCVLLAALLMACGGDGAGPVQDEVPANNEPGNNEPGNNEPGNNEPGNNEPGNNEPGNNEPANNEPGNNEPGNNEPGNNEPGNNENPTECESQDVAEAIDTSRAEIDEMGFLYTRNPQARGLILLFHGGGGSKEDFFEGRIELVLIIKEALEQGYAVAALDSVAHLNGQNNANQWSEDDTEANVDVRNALGMIDALRDPDDLAAVPQDTPIFLVGVSNGGSMLSRLAQFVDVAAAAVYVSNAVRFHDEDASIPPLILLPGINDPGQALRSNGDLRDAIEAQGGIVEFHPNLPDAVTPGSFTRIPGVDCELSLEALASLEESGWIAEDGTLAFNPKSDRSWLDILPDDLTAAPAFRMTSDVLVELHAEHTPSSDSNPLVFGFFEAQLD